MAEEAPSIPIEDPPAFVSFSQPDKLRSCKCVYLNKCNYNECKCFKAGVGCNPLCICIINKAAAFFQCCNPKTDPLITADSNIYYVGGEVVNDVKEIEVDLSEKK